MNKKCLLLFAFFYNSQLLFSQENISLSWSEPQKRIIIAHEMAVVDADSTGTYVMEQRVYGLGLMSSSERKYELYKFDNNSNEVFKVNYKKETSGKLIHSFDAMGGNLYVFATDEKLKDKTFNMYAAGIDKMTGKMPGAFTLLGSFKLDNKNDAYDAKIMHVNSDKSLVMVTTVTGKEQLSLWMNFIDPELKVTDVVTISRQFAPETYELKDVLYTIDRKIILLEKVLRKTLYDAKNVPECYIWQYIITVYDNNGKKEREIPFDIGDKHVVHGKVKEISNGKLLLSFSTNSSSCKDESSGLYMIKLNPLTGEVLASLYKDLTVEKVAVEAAGADKALTDSIASLKKTNIKYILRGIRFDLQIRDMLINENDQSITLIAEGRSYRKIYTYTGMSRFPTGLHYNTVLGDLLFIQTDSSLKISWMNFIAKYQDEQLYSRAVGWPTQINFYRSPFYTECGEHHFSTSFSYTVYNSKLILLLNDHKENLVNKSVIDGFKKFQSNYDSNLYGLTIDLKTGLSTRQILKDNYKKPIVLPSYAYVRKNEFILPAWEFLKKTTPFYLLKVKVE